MLKSSLLGLLLVLATGVPTEPQEQAAGRRETQVNARRYAFSPPEIDVLEGDLVKVTLVADDIPHSLTIDEYRISKRAKPGHSVVFEFRADRSGTFPFYCNLKQDDGCRQMRGSLRVRRR
ncbi:MAG: cupredoxin domain-containing protein [Acidobacteria bacterium]|nr:cupredoxin domain-containing protein [Acidobacteriota bacterium]